jgi:hypothetical protein
VKVHDGHTVIAGSARKHVLRGAEYIANFMDVSRHLHEMKSTMNMIQAGIQTQIDDLFDYFRDKNVSMTKSSYKMEQRLTSKLSGILE